MNNKGFGLPEVLVFIGASMFILVVITIYCNNNIFNNSYSSEKEENVSTDKNNEIVPNKQLIPNDYNKLEEQLKKMAYNYQFNKDENTIITLEKLNIDIFDPIDNNIKCTGYVIYKSNEKEYIPFINCPGMYTTKNYDENFK